MGRKNEEKTLFHIFNLHRCRVEQVQRTAKNNHHHKRHADV